MPTNITVQQYRPSEIIIIFNELLASQQTAGRLVCIRGVYLAGRNVQYNGCYYDSLRDESSNEELTIKLSQSQRNELTNGNLVEIFGTLGRNITQRGMIQLLLNVSRVEVRQAQVIDEAEMRRSELRQRKVAEGFKNLDTLLETMLFNNERPRIALVLPTGTIVRGDFNAGINAARVAIDFLEENVTFTHTTELCNKLRMLDTQGYTAIALVRGGGVDPNTDVDKLEVIETVVTMRTPFVSGVGHDEERIFLRAVADKWTSTPQGLGQYFSELVERIEERRTRSLAALTAQIRNQFQQQLDNALRQNNNLQQQLRTISEGNQRSLDQLSRANSQLQNTVNYLNQQARDNERTINNIRRENRRLKMRKIPLQLVIILVAIIVFLLLFIAK